MGGIRNGLPTVEAEGKGGIINCLRTRKEKRDKSKLIDIKRMRINKYKKNSNDNKIMINGGGRKSTKPSKRANSALSELS